MSPSQQRKDLSRRDFGLSLATLAATPIAVQAAAEPAKPKDPLQADAQALGDLAQGRFGKYLNAEQLKGVRGRIKDNLNTAEEMRKFKLNNGDEPSTVFSA